MVKKNNRPKLDYKFYIFLIIFLVIYVLFVCISFDSSLAEGTEKSSSSTHLDEIQDYEIKIVPRKDGTLDMLYHIEWTVLDDQKEGPLTWVKIGIPNSRANEFIGSSPTIKSIKYYGEGGDYARIVFNEKYYAGQTVKFEFSIHQPYMYNIDNTNNICTYSFTPGWFDEIDVKKITIYWKSDNVLESTAQSSEGDYLIWTRSLFAGERMNITVKYNTSVFELDEKMQANNASSSDSRIIIIIIIAVIAIIIIVVLIVSHDDDYDSGSGFGSGGYHHTYIVHSSSRSSCACVSSCACACACAGGGRAGCSKKDFYSSKIVKVKDLQKALEK